jgi:hypothetical protein
MLTTRRQFIGLTTVGAVVVFCSLLVDRPLALWLNARFSGTTAFAVGALILRSSDPLAVAALVLFVVALVWKRLFTAPSWVSRFIGAGYGAAAGLTVALVLKVAIGRSQVYPAFLQNHTYGLRPFAGITDFMAFPSATMAAIGGLAAGFGIQSRSQRSATAVVLITIAAALAITRSHWLSDIIAGTYIGVVSGAMAVRSIGRGEGLRSMVGH